MQDEPFSKKTIIYVCMYETSLSVLNILKYIPSYIFLVHCVIRNEQKSKNCWGWTLLEDLAGENRKSEGERERIDA